MSLPDFRRLWDVATGCRVDDIREVDWEHHDNARYDYFEVKYYSVARNGATLYWVDSVEVDRAEGPPGYAYICVSCDEKMQHWSDVILHVVDAAE